MAKGEKPAIGPRAATYGKAKGEDPLKDPWKKLRKRPGVTIHSTARRGS